MSDGLTGSLTTNKTNFAPDWHTKPSEEEDGASHSGRFDNGIGTLFYEKADNFWAIIHLPKTLRMCQDNKPYSGKMECCFTTPTKHNNHILSCYGNDFYISYRKHTDGK